MEAFALPALEGTPVETAASAATRAERLLAEARAAAHQIEAEAEAAGRERGHADGLAEALARLEPARTALEQAAAGVAAAQAELAAALERRAAELGLALAEKIVSAALELEPERVCDVVAGALRRSASRDRLVLHVHPADRETVEAAAATLAGAVGGVQELEVRAERRVERGGCVVVTDVGEIDAQPSEQLAKAREVVLDAVRRR